MKCKRIKIPDAGVSSFLKVSGGRGQKASDVRNPLFGCRCPQAAPAGASFLKKLGFYPVTLTTQTWAKQ
jgi:hypothetical protein